MRKYVPFFMRLALARMRMQLRYLRRGYLRRMGKPAGETVYRHNLSLVQPVFRTASSANKVHNLKLASADIRKFVFEPGDYISFWHMIGAPDAKKGYLPGRNLVNGVLKEEAGGGLCQLSGLMYHLALAGGLEIVERYNHSVDIYREEERFTPLGADATVVYGYKNLLLRNTSTFTLYFDFLITDNRAEGRLYASGPLPEYRLEFRREERDEKRFVHTYRNGVLLHSSEYAVKSPA